MASPSRVRKLLLIGVGIIACITLYQYQGFFGIRGELQASSIAREGTAAGDAGDDDTDSKQFDYCTNNRGVSGNWYVHPTMGRQTFYSNGYRSSKWHRENKHNATAVYEGNMYAWNDTTSFSTHECRPITALTKKDFCDTMQRLEIRRLLLVGDSLMGHQLDSLVSLMGYNACDFNKCRKNAVIVKDSIECTTSKSAFSVRVQYHRENLGANLRESLTNLEGRDDAIDKAQRQQFGPEIPYCVDGKHNQSDAFMSPLHYCPWHKLYNSTMEKTLLLLNQGAHFHSVETYTKSMELFVRDFNTIGHDGDIVVFRNTVPGHARCFDGGVTPITSMTHDAFLDRYYTTNYDWNLFDRYNGIAKSSLTDIRSDVTVHYLNVYNMTVLRPDSHAAANDCLHYTLPGPVDFWNHLLFTNLADMADKLSTS
jgi:hypothetical protein